jgi:hypothetical protein
MNTGNCSDSSKEPNRQVEDKLKQLEHDLDRKPHGELPAAVSSQDLIKAASPTLVKDDLYYFSGIALMAFAVLVFFQHVRVGTGFIQALGLGAGGFGLLMLPLLVGIGLIVYNRKNKIGYAVISVTSALILYTVLASLIMTFSPISFLGLIIMLAPLAVGGALFVKGMGGPKGIEYRLRKQGLLKSVIESEHQPK